MIGDQKIVVFAVSDDKVATRWNMIKKEMIAMLLAGGQGSRLGVLTAKMAKPAVSFGGKYRIIDLCCVSINNFIHDI